MKEILNNPRVTSLYSKEIFQKVYCDHEILDPKRERELLDTFTSGRIINNGQIETACESSRTALDELIQNNQRLIHSRVVKKRESKTMYMDLVQAGEKGLLKALEKFDIQMTNRFSSYAVYLIRKEINREIADNFNTIRIPYSTKRRIMNSNSNEKLKNELRCLENTLSLEQPYGNDGESDNRVLGDILEDESPSAESIIIMREEMESAKEILSQLNKDQRDVYLMHQGILDGHKRSFSEIAKEKGICRQRACQIYQAAVKMIEKMAETA